MFSRRFFKFLGIHEIWALSALTLIIQFGPLCSWSLGEDGPKPILRPLEKEPRLRKLFVPAAAKEDAPEEIKEFFELANQSRLDLIEINLTQIDRSKAKLQGLKRKRLSVDEMAEQSAAIKADIDQRHALVGKLFNDVAFVPAYESMTGAKPDAKMLKPGMVLRFSRPVRVVKVIDGEQAVVTVEQQFVSQRRNKMGQEVSVVENRPVSALAKVKTDKMTGGKLFEIRESLHIVGQEIVEGESIYVLEPFRVEDYLQQKIEKLPPISDPA